MHNSLRRSSCHLGGSVGALVLCRLRRQRRRLPAVLTCRWSWLLTELQSRFHGVFRLAAAPAEPASEAFQSRYFLLAFFVFWSLFPDSVELLVLLRYCCWVLKFYVVESLFGCCRALLVTIHCDAEFREGVAKRVDLCACALRGTKNS